MLENLSIHLPKQEPVLCSRLIARKISDKNASEYQAGGDSKRENLCQHDSERVNKTTPSIKLGQMVATEDPSSEQKIHLHPNLDGEKYIRKFDDPAKKNRAAERERARILQSSIGQDLCKIW